MMSPKGGPPRVTPNGYSTFECISALQKSIRRGLEVEAMHWFLELEEAGLFNWAVKRLRVTSYEDVGIADTEAVVFANRALDEAAWWHKAKSTSWRLCVANAVLVLCRAEKSRIADHFQAAVRGRRLRWKESGHLPPVPDWAVDKHTPRGKKLGRDVEHFVTEGTVLEIDCELLGDREYRAEAVAMWKREEAEARGLNGDLFEEGE